MKVTHFQKRTGLPNNISGKILQLNRHGYIYSKHEQQVMCPLICDLTWIRNALLICVTCLRDFHFLEDGSAKIKYSKKYISVFIKYVRHKAIGDFTVHNKCRFVVSPLARIQRGVENFKLQEILFFKLTNSLRSIFQFLENIDIR